MTLRRASQDKVCSNYDTPMTRHILPWLPALAGRAEVPVADPGRTYLPAEGMEKLAADAMPTNLERGNKPEKLTSLYWLKPPSP